MISASSPAPRAIAFASDRRAGPAGTRLGLDQHPLAEGQRSEQVNRAGEDVIGVAAQRHVPMRATGSDSRSGGAHPPAARR